MKNTHYCRVRYLVKHGVTHFNRTVLGRCCFPTPADLGAACNRCGCYKSRLSGSETGKSPTTGETVSLRSATPSPSEDGTRLALAGLEERLLQARQDFEDGMEAYMREEAEARAKLRYW